MKELSTEEKAKAYDEALKLMKDCVPDKDGLVHIRPHDIFPELAESEDELTWLTKYIEEEAYSLSIDIRDNEDRIKLKNLQRPLAWLEKQAEQSKKVSIWKHWKDGIAGNGDGRQIYLTRQNGIYNVSSCLGCECDYIKLSELDKL